MIWFKRQKKTKRIAMIFALLFSIGIVAYAAGLLLATVHSNTTLVKDHFLSASLDGATAAGSIKPGESVSLAPVITNDGDINAGVFIKITMPAVDGVAAYDFEAASGWNCVMNNGNIQVWSYGTNSVLESLSPGSSTDPLTEYGFTMKSEITGLQFMEMDSVDIEFDGYLIDYEQVEDSDPETAWALIG